MPSPKKSPKSSPKGSGKGETKGSPKGSPKKSGRPGSPGKGVKLSHDEIIQLENKFFARKRYETMSTVFKKTSPVLSIYMDQIHLYEIWNRIPAYEQFCNSNSAKKSSPKGKKASPKKSPKNKPGVDKPGAGDDGIDLPDHEPAKATGVIAVHKSHILGEKRLFLEITAHFSYFAHSRVPPFPDNVAASCQCFRDVLLLYPIDLDTSSITPISCQYLILKLRKTLPRGYRMFPFTFEVSRKPDSIFFTRPFYPEFTSGLRWQVKAFLAREENCVPQPEDQITMEFFKYTITPTLTPATPRPTPAIQYSRFSTIADSGDLMLTGQLERDIFYHGQEIKVKIHIENNSSRHVVHSLAVFVEQTYRLFHQFPHDSSIPIGQVLLQPGEAGLPVNPKHKSWSKEVVIKPVYDQTRYNLAIDGKMESDKKVFLASSTVIMNLTQVEELVKEDPVESAKPKTSPTGSPGKAKNSPKGKKSPKPGGSPKSAKSPKPSPGRKKASPKEANQHDRKVSATQQNMVTQIKDINTLTNKQACRTAFISYDVVVRLNLKLINGEESGHPMIRLPFVLTRETRYLDKLQHPPPPTWGQIILH